MDDFHRLARIRRERTQAKQVAIHRVLKSGKPAARPTVYEYPDRVAARLRSLESLNPGTRYTIAVALDEGSYYPQGD